jgi:hypothetical protein
MARATQSFDGIATERRTEDTVNPEVVVRKLANKILPVLFLLALLAYLDRSNISFGARQLGNATGIGDAEYGFGGSAFFVGYATLQLPSMAGARTLPRSLPCCLSVPPPSAAHTAPRSRLAPSTPSASSLARSRLAHSQRCTST